MAEQGPIESAAEFRDAEGKESPEQAQKRWTVEMTAAKDNQKAWWSEGDKVVRRFLGESAETGASRMSALHVFHATVTTQRALLYGKMPQVDVGRREEDPEDDAARVAGEMVQRLANTDLERADDGYTAALRYALEDWTLPGLGFARCRYVRDEEKVPGKPALLREDGSEAAPAVPETSKLSREDVETDYVYWRDVRWSPARTYHEWRWGAVKAEMTKDAVAARFGKSIASAVPLKQKQITSDDASPDELKDAWSRCEVWEIWSKEDGKVYWWAEGAPRILDMKDDPLQLDGFFPWPRPLIANATTTKWIPKPDFKLAEPQYNEIDELTGRIKLLQDALRVAGVYDESNEGLEQLLTSGGENQLIPVKSFASLSEKGGLAGAIQFLPLKEVADTLTALRAQRQETIALLYQITGSSDVERGQAARRKTATEGQTEAGYSNTRSQTKQDEFARFASDLQRIRAEIIAKHFAPETIRARSNVDRVEIIDAPRPPPMPGGPPPPPPQKVPNEQLIQAALQLLKDDAIKDYRIAVRPESIALPDLATLKQEGMEFLQAAQGFLSALQPIAAVPGMAPIIPDLLELMKWGLSRFRGAATAESITDRLVSKAEKMASTPPPPPQPDPTAMIKAQSEQARAQADITQTGMEMQQSREQHAMDMTKMQTQAQIDALKAGRQMAAAAAKPQAPGVA